MPREKHGRGLIERNFYLGVAAGCCGVHSLDNPRHVATQRRPLLVADHDEGDFSARQILLITNVFVGRQQKLEPCGLCCRYQFAVDKPVPSAMASTTT